MIGTLHRLTLIQGNTRATALNQQQQQQQKDGLAIKKQASNQASKRTQNKIQTAIVTVENRMQVLVASDRT